MKVTLTISWRILWIGAFIDKEGGIVHISPFPFVMFSFQRKRPWERREWWLRESE